MNTENDNSEAESVDIRNCRFAYRCPMTWDVLLKTENDAIRYCVECDRGVHLCKTDDQLSEAIKENKCVAVVIYTEDGEEVDAIDWPLGDVMPSF